MGAEERCSTLRRWGGGVARKGGGVGWGGWVGRGGAVLEGQEDHFSLAQKGEVQGRV